MSSSRGISKAWVHFAAKDYLTELDSEETLFSPWGAPWVLSNPVVDSVFTSPTNNFNCVLSSVGTSSLWVDSTLIVVDVRIDIEDGDHGPVGLDVFHLIINVGEGDGAAWLALEFLEGLTASSAWCRAFVFKSSVGNTRAWWSSRASEIVKSLSRLATRATLLFLATSDVLGWEDNVNLSAWSNTKSIWKDFSGAEGPAWIASTLVHDWMDTFTPLCSWIEGSVRGSLPFRDMITISAREIEIIVVGSHDTTECLKLFIWLVSKGIFIGFKRSPHPCLALNLINDLFVDMLVLLCSERYSLLV